jgi:hypothetical protein
MLTSPLNINLGLTALASSTVLSMPYGWSGALLPMLLFGAGEIIASLFIPSSATFRNKVDREFARKRREAAAEHLIQEITKRCSAKDPRWATYDRLRERVSSLREIAKSRRTAISERDLERLDDVCGDFLGLWLAQLSMAERQKAVSEHEIENRIAEISKRIDNGAADSRSLQKARGDLEELLLRHRRLASRKAAVDAALLSLPDALEEIYHAVVSTPASGESGGRLQEAIERLRLEEELEDNFGAEIREIAPEAVKRPAVPVRPVAITGGKK